MKIVNLSSKEYREFANTNNYSNFGQSLEYSRIITNRRKRNLFLGMVDDDNNLVAAALILIRSINTFVKEAVAPNGYIIDYANFDLVKSFTQLLKKRLQKEGITYLITNPMFKYKVYNKNNVLLVDNENIYNNLLALDYESMGYFSEFEEYDVILETTDSINDTYNHINRNSKRNINDCLRLGITLHKATINDLEVFYNIIKKKTKKKYSFYESIMNIYNNKDNQAELYFAKINPHEYLINTKNRYESYHIENEKIHKEFTKHIGDVSDKLLNKKINSDKTLEKYRNELKEAIELDQHYKEDIIVGTSMIIRNNHEVYFLIDGYKEEFRHMHGTHILKWAIIKKYHELGYRIFNLGEIHNTYYDKNSSYYNQYKYKISFGGNVVQYTPNLIYIINKPIFRLFQKVNRKH